MRHLSLALVTVSLVVVDFLTDVPALNVSSKDARAWDLTVSVFLVVFAFTIFAGREKS